MAWIKSGKIYEPYVPSWSNGTDEEIVEVLEKHYNDKIDLTEYWAIGDERIINLSAMSAMSPLDDAHISQNIVMILMHAGGKELTTSINGHTTCAFIVGQKDCLITKGGLGQIYWDEMPRRTWCNSTYKEAFPSTIKNIFKECINYSGSYYGKRTTNDYFALPCEKEVFDTNYYGNFSQESDLIQFDYYKTLTNRIKHEGNESSTNCYWWTRSGASSNVESIVEISSDGTGSTIKRYTSYCGIAPFGVI